jgi:hypothetical protein
MNAPAENRDGGSRARYNARRVPHPPLYSCLRTRAVELRQDARNLADHADLTIRCGGASHGLLMQADH